MTDKQLLKQALEALQMADELEEGYGVDFKKYGLKVDKDICAKYEKAITAIRARLEQPEQEPVAKPKLIGWRTADFLNETNDIRSAKNWEVHYEVLPIFEGDPNTKLATPPAAQRQWVGLTEQEIDAAFDYSNGTRLSAGRAIEAKLRDKNGGAA